MNIGYFFWGHLSDKLGENTKNTPDGNAWYSSSIIHELQKRKHNVFLLSIDRDKEDFNIFKEECFKSFEFKKRINVYKNSKWCKWNDTFSSLIEFPKLDILLLEWRFLIQGRNDLELENSVNWQPDLKMQTILLNYYSKQKTKIIIFDLDYKLTIKDEEQLLKQFSNNIFILETAKKIKQTILPRISVEIPFWIINSKIFKNKKVNKNKQIVYIGSNYEREDSINKYILPFSKENPFTCWFYGNWRNYPEIVEKIYCDLKWRDIQYHHRVGHSDFLEVYNDSICCPLLAKQEYYKNGFTTARIQECLYFGSIPIGFKEHYKIEEYLPKELIVSNFKELIKTINFISNFSIKKRNNYREMLWNNLKFMDVKYFINILENLYEK